MPTAPCLIHCLLCSVCIAVIGTVAVRAQPPAPHPAELTAEGAGQLALAGEATRSHLLGAVDLYSLALYVGGPMSDRAELASSALPKALRIVALYKEDLQRAERLDWQRELVPTLNPDATAHLRRTFASLRHGDAVLIEYSPGRGTTVRVNKTAAVTDASHDVMLAFLDHWLGQRPVSEEIRRKLLGTAW
ncbi:MAG TPA: chalcone isomerase family protein [Vicinamibacterales bacterium]|nr:chalcone isomerase family protein [Vicinamibacterales bacterium]